MMTRGQLSADGKMRYGHEYTPGPKARPEYLRRVACPVRLMPSLGASFKAKRMLDHILIETKDERNHSAFEVEHTGEKFQVFTWRGEIESLEKRIRWEYRKRFNRGTLTIKRAQQCVQATSDRAAESLVPASDAVTRA